MATVKEPSENLLAARRALEDIGGVTILNDWTWSEVAAKWMLHSRLTIDMLPDSLVAGSSDWYVLVDESYPWGKIKFYPAKVGGIVQTFHHQSFNSIGNDQIPWRAGDICVDTSVHVLGRHGYDSEPYDINKRLRWRFRRALDWLTAASKGELTLPGEPFELPQLPSSSALKMVFQEGTVSYKNWQQIPDRAGLVELARLGSDSSIFVVEQFKSASGKPLWQPQWGKIVEGSASEELLGVWVRVNAVPILSAWQTPSSWGELRKAIHSQGIDVDDILKKVVRLIRDRKGHFALIGFPVPSRIGETPSLMHWQTLMLPVLSAGKLVARGFRPNENGYWHRDRYEVLRSAEALEWIGSENWHPDQISSRGRLSMEVVSKKILLIGAGAVGSAVAELLVRAGVQDLIILDDDRLQVGNLTRHTLGLDQINKLKAEGVAARLNQATPNASVRAICSKFPPQSDVMPDMQSCDVVIDCTAQDEVLHDMGLYSWKSVKLFISISLGIQAQRLFFFAAHGDGFSHESFRKQIQPWLDLEAAEHQGEEFPWEGIGCWHPVFPARIDDVWLMAAAAIKYIETAIVSPPQQPELTVLEQRYEQGGFVGISRVLEVPGG
jgi:hypothetical protein